MNVPEMEAALLQSEPNSSVVLNIIDNNIGACGNVVSTNTMNVVRSLLILIDRKKPIPEILWLDLLSDSAAIAEVMEEMRKRQTAKRNWYCWRGDSLTAGDNILARMN